MNIRKETIQERQNEELMLKIQYVARAKYNSAEKQGNIAWVMCFASAATVFIPSSLPEMYLIMAPILCDVLALTASIGQNSLVKTAANYREYFDACVFDINDTPNKTYENDIKEYCMNHSRECDIQTNNTGLDTPPGVRNWYDLTEVGPNDNAVFECQKQNAWWDEKLSKKRVALLALFIIIASVVLVVLWPIIKDTNGVTRVIFSSAMIIKAIERLKAEYEYEVISHKIEGAIGNMSVGLSEENVLDLQKWINEKRHCNVVGMDILHKKLARSLSKTYQTISK